MRIAVVSEVSTLARNTAVVSALKKHGERIFNAGMRGHDGYELTYLHTGLMAGLLLNCGACELVVGGCGTGQGFSMSAMMYPGVTCGLLHDPLDGFLFSQINDGNCISLALNKGYGWAGEVGLEQIMNAYFSGSKGAGYPPERRESQCESRRLLNALSGKTHHSMEHILTQIPPEIIRPVLQFPGFMELIKAQGSNTRLVETLSQL